MNIILISTYSRPLLFHHTLHSLYQNGKATEHHVTVVINGSGNQLPGPIGNVSIYTPEGGASAARNIGASSIPKYRRQHYLMFTDDDAFFAKEWDEKLLDLADHHGGMSIVSGHAHPFNHAESKYEPHNMLNGCISYGQPLVISSVNMLMSWDLWDEVGFFAEPGGAGGSEDYDYCMRAKAKGYGFAVTEPQVVLHTGITSSNGRPIVGQKEVMDNNRKLMEIHGLKDVRFE